ncbi:MAG: FMN-binding protein, partial [Proteocatella sp.]
QQMAANDDARKQIIPDAESFEPVEGDFGPGVVEVYKAMNGSEELAYIIKTVSKGYGGDIEIISGIKMDGTIAGAVIGTMTETPGLGAKAQDQPFISQYNGKTIEQPLVVSKSATGADNEIVAISGATITSKAVTDGINIATDVFNNNFK